MSLAPEIVWMFYTLLGVLIFSAMFREWFNARWVRKRSPKPTRDPGLARLTGRLSRGPADVLDLDLYRMKKWKERGKNALHQKEETAFRPAGN